MRQEDNNEINFSDATIAEPEATLAKPSMYKVMLLNDEYTPNEFVGYILQKFFNKAHEESTKLSVQVMSEGVAVCGFYTRDVAETKVGMVNDYSRRNQHPLKCTFEEDI